MFGPIYYGPRSSSLSLKLWVVECYSGGGGKDHVQQYVRPVLYIR